MTLFSSFNQPIIFLLFVYLGLVSGLIFNVFSSVSNFLINRTKKGLEKTLLNENKLKPKQVLEKTVNNQNKPQKQPKNNIFKTVFKNFSSIKKTTQKILTYILLFLFKNLPTIIFIITIVLSYIINLYLNFGHLRLICVLIWVLFFFTGKTLCKILANYFLSFYNYFIKRIKKDGRAKQ